VRNVNFVEDLLEAKRTQSLQDNLGRILPSGGVRVQDNNGQERLMFIDNGKVDQGSEVKIRVLDKQKVSPPSTDEGKQSPIVQVKKLRSNRGVPPNRMGINYNLMSFLLGRYEVSR